jgi:hypothetical protein
MPDIFEAIACVQLFRIKPNAIVSNGKGEYAIV